MAAPVLVGGATGVTNAAIYVRGDTCRLTSVSIFNPSAAVAFVQLFDAAVAPTVGTTAPTLSYGTNTLADTVVPLSADGILFSKGLWVAASTTAGGNTAPATNLNVNLTVST